MKKLLSAGSITGNKKSRKGKLSTQFNIMVAVMTTVIVAVMIIISGVVTASNVTGELTDQCVTGTNMLAYELSLNEVAEMEDKTEVLERLKEITGYEYTIFNGDIREFTTIIVDGERVVGTALDPTIANIVLNEGQSYVGEAVILGESHITSYIPYYNGSGEIVGVLFSGVSSHANDAAINNSLTISMLVGIALILVACIILKIVVDRTVAKPLAKVMDAAQSISQGYMNFDLDIQVNNEIGLLSDQFNEMKYTLSSLNTILVDMLGNIAKGNWNVDAGSPDIYVGDWNQLYNSVNEMTSSVKGALTQVSSSAMQISASVELVSSGAQALAEGSINQADSVDRLSQSLQDISAQVEDNSTNTKKVNDIAVVSGEVTKATLEDMQQMLEAMKDISSTSENIEKVIKVIDDIAFQTNILALNAAVEAARAGAAGKGFAVVADEVRNLAQKSAEAVQNTTQLIDHSINAVQVGEGIAQKASASFESLAEKVQQMVVTIDEIAKATEEQTGAIREISSGIEQISMVVQSNTATSEESAAASGELAVQANTLHTLVDRFQL